MKKLNLLKEFLIINVGLLIVAAGVVFFMMPSNLTLGSITGLAMILGNFIPLPVSTLVLIFNIVLLAVGFTAG